MIKKKTSKKQLSPSERHLGVVLEDINSKIDLVVEGHQGLDKKIERLDNKIEYFKKEVNDRFNAVIGRFDEMDYKFEIVFGELHLIRNDLKEKISRDEFALLEKRVVALEKSRK